MVALALLLATLPPVSTPSFCDRHEKGYGYLRCRFSGGPSDPFEARLHAMDFGLARLPADHLIELDLSALLDARRDAAGLDRWTRTALQHTPRMAALEALSLGGWRCPCPRSGGCRSPRVCRWSASSSRPPSGPTCDPSASCLACARST